MKTIKQLAMELNISKQALTKYINNQNDNIRQLVVKKGNKFLIDESLELIIKNHYKEVGNLKKEEKNNNINTNKSTTKTTTDEVVNLELIEMLKKELHNKDKLIEDLREDNKRLNRSLIQALENQQQIMLDFSRNQFTDKLIEAKKMEVESEDKSKVVEVDKEVKSEISWLKKFFKDLF